MSLFDEDFPDVLVTNVNVRDNHCFHPFGLEEDESVSNGKVSGPFWIHRDRCVNLSSIYRFLI